MAIFYCNADIVSRSKGQNVIAKAAYEARTRLKDEQEGRTKDYSKKGGLLYQDIFTPDNAPEWMRSREQLWNAVKRKEDESKHWKTAQEARRFIIALPHENSIEKNIELSKQIANVFVKYGMCADFAVHKPDTSGDEKEINYHMHILTTLRDVDKNNIHGFGNKNRSWNDRKFYHDILENEIAQTINNSLPDNIQKVDFTPYDETKQSYKGAKHDFSRMTTDARERRLKKAQAENLQKEKDVLREMLRIEGDKYLELNIKKPEPPQPQQTKTAETAKKPEPPKTKEELFIAICKNAEPYLTQHLKSEITDLKTRGEKVKKGEFDEYYRNDALETNKTWNLLGEAIKKNDYNSWKNLYNNLYPPPQNFKYGNARYRIYENIRQPYIKLEKDLFAKQPDRIQTQNREQEGGIKKI